MTTETRRATRLARSGAVHRPASPVRAGRVPGRTRRARPRRRYL